MTEKKIHIVSFNVPFPADYGGVIDVYYRIKSLHKLGFKIILHCYDYGRGEQIQLSEITEKVYYYKRKKSILSIFNKRPFIVATRRSKELLNRLLEDNIPILFEGLHSCWYLENKEIQKRVTFVRTHNIEHDYYYALAKKSSFFKGIYFQQEANKLKRYESILKFSKTLLCIKESEREYFSRYSNNTFVLQASLPEIEEHSYILTEEYALFNGNLSVSENEKAAIWIIENIWKLDSKLPPLKIAGKNPSEHLKRLANENNIQLIPNPSQTEMEKLLSKARIHILISDQATGVKLKLLSAMQTTGHLLVNPFMVEGTDLKEVCILCEKPSAFTIQIKLLINKELGVNEFQKRQEFINEKYNTLKNCSEIFENEKSLLLSNHKL